MKEANLNSSAPEPGMTLLSAAHVEAMHRKMIIKINKNNECS